MRAHLLKAATDVAGNLLANSVVAVYQNGTGNTPTPVLFSNPIYVDETSPNLLGNPYTTPDGNINFYLDSPQRIDLGITPPGAAPYVIMDVDVIVSSASTLGLTFPGPQPNSTQVGAAASATQQQAVALGDTASATGQQATAAGQSSTASATQATAVGQAAQASALQATALGAAALASQQQATALGEGAHATGQGAIAAGPNTAVSGQNAAALGLNASAANLASAAIGANAATSENYQVMLGPTPGVVDIPDAISLNSLPGKIKFRLYVTDSGLLYTRYHHPVDAVNLLAGNDQLATSGSIGGWAAGSNVTVAASAAFLFGTATGGMLITQTAAGPAYAQSVKQAVNAGSYYVARSWMFRHAGDGTATQFQAWLGFYNAGNTLIGSATLGPPQTIVNDTWIAADARVLAPAGAVTAALQIGVPSGGASTNKLYACTAGIFLAPAVL